MICAVALLVLSTQTIKVDVAEGFSAHAAKSEIPAGESVFMHIDEKGEPCKVYQQGKNIRVEMGTSLVLLFLKGDEYIVADLKAKKGARYLVRSERFPQAEKPDSARPS